MKNTKNLKIGNGIYKLNKFSGAYHLTPVAFGGLFRSNYRNLENHANVLFYIDESRLNAERDSTRYLALELARDSYFDVLLSTQPNADLAKYADIVIPRFDPPLKEYFVEELRNYDDGSRLFINPPSALKYFSDKNYLEEFADSGILPKTMISSDPIKVGYFMRGLGEQAIYKPTHGFGGEGIQKIELNGKSLEDLIDMGFGVTLGGSDEVVVQEYIKNIENYGDKRIHIVNGKPIGAILRKPKKGSFLCNQKQGASFEKSNVTAQDYEILEKIQPILDREGVFWAGIDVIGPYLGEVNAVSPGLLFAMDEINGDLNRSYSAAGCFAGEILNKSREEVLA